MRCGHYVSERRVLLLWFLVFTMPSDFGVPVGVLAFVLVIDLAIYYLAVVFVLISGEGLHCVICLPLVILLLLILCV